MEGNAEDFVAEKADLVIANIHHELMVKLIDKEGFCSTDWLILSGLMRSQVRDTRQHLEKHRLRIIREWDYEGTWHTLLVRGVQQES
ncbi:MAG: 50S ribosomal protein L11 methyltransferase [Deltaproteobacteria bacterium]